MGSGTAGSSSEFSGNSEEVGQENETTGDVEGEGGQGTLAESKRPSSTAKLSKRDPNLNGEETGTNGKTEDEEGNGVEGSGSAK